MKDANEHLRHIRHVYPDLAITLSRLHAKEGQFSDIVVVNESLIFRFPRTPDVAKDMSYEVALLKKLQGRLPLPIPNPIYEYFEAENLTLPFPNPATPPPTFPSVTHFASLIERGEKRNKGEGIQDFGTNIEHSPTKPLIFMGYPMIPGAPLWRETLAAIKDEKILDRLAVQLAGFLKALHSTPAAEITDRPAGETHESWSAMYTAMRDQLYPHMRPDARQKVSENFETFLSDPANFAYEPVLRHGDFGTGNILYDAEKGEISGVIDFSFSGAGDMAQDVGALLGYGESFMERCYAVYPEMRETLKRVRFFRTTYALQQALYALRDGNREDFEDGMREYV